jgi:hypothetical protein
VTGRRLRAPVAVAAALLTLLALVAGHAPAAAAAGNASAAAGFLEDAQNDDGGFGAKKGDASDPDASLWAALGLLAAGKHPLDEYNKGGRSLDGYLVKHRKAYTSLQQRGALALVAAAAGVDDAHYGSPAAALRGALTEPAARADAGGAALAVLGLLAAGDDASRTTATAAARTLLASALPDGGWGQGDSSSSAATALVLQAIAKAGVAGADAAPVAAGIAYLGRAQGNDGAVAVSVRTDQALNGGDVGATAFAIQAFAALGVAPPKTATGKTLRDGLTQYQQQTTGGLSSAGSLYDTSFAPSVVETAQAFPAFNGDAFPLVAVAAQTSGPPAAKAKAKDVKKAAPSKKVSSGSAKVGVSAQGADTHEDQGAFRQARAGQQQRGRRGTKDAKGAAGKGAAPRDRAAATATAGAGEAVSGQVVGTTAAPKLATRAGQEPDALSAQDRATIGLGGLLGLLLVAGAVAGSRHPRRDERPRTQVALIAAGGFLARARARGSLAPAAVVAVGLALVALPFATHLWDRAPQGERLLAAYQPYMSPERVAAYQRDVAQLDAGVREAVAKGPAELHPDAKPAAARRAFARGGPLLADFAQKWPATHRSLRAVVDPIAAHRAGYVALAALPRFGLFPWLFAIPGGVLVALGALALAWPRAWRFARWGVTAVAVGLLAAAPATHLWDRAPKGAALVEAFTPIETRATVERVQNDFGRVAIAQGALAGELIPALQRHGLRRAQIDARFPAVRTVQARWIPILNDLTPVLGALSDNVGRFQAVAALPPLTAFPWLLALPGALLLAIVALSALAPLAVRQKSRSPIKEHHVPAPIRQ